MKESVVTDFQEGEINGTRWFKGTIPVRRNKFIYIDTRTGIGIQEVLDSIDSFITYQASRVNFPSYSQEDIVQEIRLLALEAIPKYKINKNANMTTFLQNHIRNRIINLCKFVSEKRRRATYYGSSYSKVKCPECKSFTKIYNGDAEITCSSCSHKTSSKDSTWKHYNLPVVPIPFGAIDRQINDRGEDSSNQILDILSDNNSDLGFIKNVNMLLDEKIQKRVDFMKMYDNLDDTNKAIIKLVIEGYTYKDIAKKVGISEKAAYARASKIIKGNKELRGYNA